MKNFLESLNTMFTAARYSFAFCWRNAPKETAGRMAVGLGGVLVTFLGIQALGYTVNVVQKLDDGNYYHLVGPGLLWAFTLLLGTLVERGEWFFRANWFQKLRFANQREMNSKRATLDVARFRSEEFDDLSRHIQELPNGPDTRLLFSEVVLTVLVSIASFVLFGATLMWYEPLAGAILFAVALPLLFTELGTQKRHWELIQKLLLHHKKRGVMEKAYSGVVTFTQALSFNQMDALGKKIKENVGVTIDEWQAARKESVRNEFISHLFITVAVLGIIVYAMYATVSSGGGVGTLAIIIGAASSFYRSIDNIVSNIAAQWTNAKGMILIERDFMGLKPLLKTESSVAPHFAEPPTIRFDRVHFTYPGKGAEVLRGISFTIKSGSKVAIVGRSGHGKTTIQALLMRQYDPTSGAIYAGDAKMDINLRNIKPEVWNTIASTLPQEYAILERRIAEEISSSRLDEEIDYERVKQAAQFAHFDEVAEERSEGYNAQIGAQFGGETFSGGENQRLALARTFYRKPMILILDEPDAKLDPESASKVMDNIFALTGITVILITHHVSHAERCDNIIVIEKGEVVEQGTHKDLLDREGEYASLYRKDKKRLG